MAYLQSAACYTKSGASLERGSSQGCVQLVQAPAQVPLCRSRDGGKFNILREETLGGLPVTAQRPNSDVGKAEGVCHLL
eukprot:622223-Prorocentrum_minimum.AAC.3